MASLPTTDFELKLAAPYSPAKQLKAVCADHEANPIAIATALDVASNKEWRDWEPETLRTFIGFGDEIVQQMDKVMAVQVAVTNPDVFEDWTLFQATVNAFNHHRCDFENLSPPSYIEAAWACVCLNKLAPHIYSPEIIRYLAVLCWEAGLVYFPWSDPKIDMDDQSRAVLDGDRRGGLSGLIRLDSALVVDVKSLWEGGAKDTSPSAISELDPVHVQLAKLVAAQEWIRAQKSANPGDYK
jgi:hypothetical protein